MDLVGKTLGQFQIVQELGKGGMATVYKGYQPSLQRYVAIKVLSPALAEDTDLVKRFLREAQSAAALHHPNVITIHDVGSQDDVHYIVMEYLEGATLAELLSQSPSLPPERVLHIVRQIASALDYAHGRGYIHRDIKPSNIMIDPQRDDRITLMDFGLVRATGGSRLTRTGFIMGTPDYMSPEQAQGEAIDQRTDIYSLGIATYHMFAGNVPFNKPTPHAILMAHILEEPPPMAAFNPETPPQIEAVVRKAIAKDPNERYAWAGDMAADLEVAILKPDTFIMPLIVEGAFEGQWPQPPAAAGPGTPPGRVTPPGGVTPYPQTPPVGATPYPQTPPVGATPYPQTPPVGARLRARPSRRGWVWPVAIVGVLAVLIVAGLLLAPTILPLIPAVASRTAAAQTATAVALLPSPTPAPFIEEFDVTPAEVTQGESVTIQWRVSGVSSVSIEPNVQQDALPNGTLTHEPTETTVYELVLPDGTRRTQRVLVNPAPGAPAIESFTATPAEQVRGAEVELAWKVTGETTDIEISVNYQPRFLSLPAEGKLVEAFDKTATLTLAASNGALKTTRTIDLRIVDPTPTATATPPPVPTETPTVTPTPTATAAPPTATPAPEQPTATPVPTRAAPQPTAPPAAGALISFEQWGAWKRGEQPYGDLDQTQEQVKSGSYAARLRYDFTGASSSDDFVVFANQTPAGGQPNAVSMWVYGDGSGHLVNVWIQDAANEVWSVALGTVGEAGWQKMSGAIAPGRPWPSGRVFGPDNGAIDYPIRFYGIVVDRTSGPKSGTIYFDDISFEQAAPGATPEPGATPTPEAPGAGQIGRIIFTVQVGEAYSLYSTDPNWSQMVKIGDTDWQHSTCQRESNTATTLDGKTVRLRPISTCPVAGTVGSCPSPNGVYKANTFHTGNTNYAVTLIQASDGKQLRAYYIGKLYIFDGINWAPDSSHFLFTDVNMGICRSDVDKDGYRVVIPFKDKDWPLQYAPDGRYVYYLKPVSGAIADVFIANPDGSGERNLTNAPISKKLCPRWRE